MTLDYKNPNYAEVARGRLDMLKRIRENPECLPLLKKHYRDSPADFISDWGMTFDPRLAERGLPTLLPFVLWPKQREWIDWVMERWHRQERGLSEKSRDWGLSWLAISLSCTLCLFRDGIAIGFGSRKEEYVDKSSQPKALLPKARIFMENLPPEFRGGWISWRDAPHLRINFPETGSIISGESGDQIGRGDRTSIFFVDEAAYIERPMLIEHSLSQTTNCRIDMSSVNGMNNPFAQNRHSGRINVFLCDWRDDPRKDQAWYEKQKSELDPITLAQEVDRDYGASTTGVVIPSAWVRAAIDATTKLGIAPSGERLAALDVGDEGADPNAFVGGQGTHIDVIEEWSGKGSNLFQTTLRAFELCDMHDILHLRFDADGLGAGVRGDAEELNARRKRAKAALIEVEPFRGSEGVLDPDGEDVKGRTNKDYFLNRKVQNWWRLRMKFQRTYRWVVEGVRCDPDDIISISSKAKLYLKLCAELSQPTFDHNTVGKLYIDKTPDGMKSHNLADATMIRSARTGAARIKISAEAMRRAAMGARR